MASYRPCGQLLARRIFHYCEFEFLSSFDIRHWLLRQHSYTQVQTALTNLFLPQRLGRRRFRLFLEQRGEHQQRIRSHPCQRGGLIGRSPQVTVQFRIGFFRQSFLEQLKLQPLELRLLQSPEWGRWLRFYLEPGQNSFIVHSCLSLFWPRAVGPVPFQQKTRDCLAIAGFCEICISVRKCLPRCPWRAATWKIFHGLACPPDKL